MPLEGIQIALRQQVSEDLIDVTMSDMPFIASLKGLDAYHKQSGLRFDVGGPLKGEALQETFRLGKPTIRAINAMETDYNQLIAPLQKGMRMGAGTLRPSSFDCHEVIEKYFVNRLEDSVDAVTNYVMETSKAIVDAMHEKWNTYLFPPTNLQPTIATGYVGSMTINRLMAIAYPLQTGYANNALTGTGTYDYLGMDLNTAPYSLLKARNDGTVAAAFGTPSIRNIGAAHQRTLNKRGRPDVFICDTDTFAFLREFGDDQVREQYSEKMNVGVLKLVLFGMVVIPEPRMDMLSDGFSDEDLAVSATEYRESYMLTSANHRWRNTPIDDLMVEDYQGGAAFQLAQGYYEACYWNRNPRQDSRQFQLTGVN